MPSPDEHVRFLATSPNRVSLLAELEEGPRRPAELVDRLDLSRSTVQRNLRELTERGWVRRDDDGYVATVGGCLVLGAYEELTDTVGLGEEYGESLEALVEAGLKLSPAVLEGATVVTATDSDPHAPLRHYTDRVLEANSTRFRGIVPVVSPLFNEAHETLLDRGIEGEIVLDSTALEASMEEYDAAFDDALATDELSLYAHGDSFSFGLTIIGDRVFLGAYEGGQFVACFEWVDTEVREEALSAYESYREAAREVDTTVLSS